ncbi:probable ubiquitin-like-specific protease 2A isoform X2 [Diospyros lotus]|uniref:probable ubiquitin-like-specific protease 2A isoform X2 n=1 Tax=Diospyros lotus TaxID=55363 RepID=UPI0022504654|nr:probable ubiquitin-like-specific protease 2A isoform X2 [Diospyros lotus]
MATTSSGKRFRVFEFDEADERVEKASKKKMSKFGNRGPDHPSLSKYQFLQYFAPGTGSKQNDVSNEILDVDASDDGGKRAVSQLDDTMQSGSSNYKTTNFHNQIDYRCSSFGLNSIEARALNHGIMSTASKHAESTLPQCLPNNEPVTIDSDDDTSPELASLKSDSGAVQDEGQLEEQKLEHYSNGCVTDATVVVSPDYIIYGDMYCSKSQLTFSWSLVKLEGSVECGIKGPVSLEWTVDDIIDIESQWCGQVQTAVVNICLTANDREVAERSNTSITELKFAVFDPNWSEKQEAIKSLDVRYKAKWKHFFYTNKARIGDACPGNNIFLSKHYFSIPSDSFEVIYPEGDPDPVSIGKKLSPEKRQKFHFFNSFFFRKLAGLDKVPSWACEGRAAFQRVQKWTRKVNLFEKDYIFIPVNFSLHWSLIIICHPGDVTNSEDEHVEKMRRVPCILHLNSIEGSHRGLKNLIQSYLWEEWKERQNPLLEDLSSKFFNLRFVPLELPQQENYYDCGLFLLHYVELFVSQAPVDFSPFRITKFSNFLSKNWFPPAEASLKRAYIEKLIYKIVEENSQKTPTSPCNDYKHSPPQLSGIDEAGSAICLLLETSRELEPGAAEGCLFESSWKMVSVGQSKNFMSPIEEGDENQKQFAHSQIENTGVQQLAEAFDDPLMATYSAPELPQFDAFSGASAGADPMLLENEINEAQLLEEDNQESDSPSTSSSSFEDYYVIDSEDENETSNVGEIKESPSHQRNVVCLSDPEAQSISSEDGADEVHHQSEESDPARGRDNSGSPSTSSGVPETYVVEDSEEDVKSD